ncbi:YigZ family protein [Cerasibacillus terrae]|uniref:YigZ family protein n=1 Tax=Cerasibacillus terrae TaxID=2498845 RepID=A0A5C8NV11_9BACI|nr:YigZ family protein [Cerasibacillus terrae]TXL65015.1 YigZ family protein [Cerasibacillus terrae]
MLSTYFTVKNEGSDEIIIQKSRFIGYVKRVETEEAAQEFIHHIKKKHHDATHNCSAYIIGEHDQIQKANDDGEPSGTAGVPILEVLKKQHLKDTAVVVTRYFGGIKLGAGGLIRAYSSTTSQAIKTTGIVKRQLMQGFSVIVEYPLLGKLENALRNSEYILRDIHYLDKVDIHIYVEDGQENTFCKWITELTSAQAEIKETDKKYLEIDVSSTKNEAE